MTSNGNGVLNLSLLQAGVASSGGVGYGSGPSIGGQRPTNNSFTIDGVDNNSKSVTGPVVYVPNDNVAEFTLLAISFGPSTATLRRPIQHGREERNQRPARRNLGILRNKTLNAVDQAYKNAGITTNPRYDQSRLALTLAAHPQEQMVRVRLLRVQPHRQASISGSTIYAPPRPDTPRWPPSGRLRTNLGVLKQYAVRLRHGWRSNITVAGVTVPRA